jgi:hypothetical protein
LSAGSLQAHTDPPDRHPILTSSTDEPKKTLIGSSLAPLSPYLRGAPAGLHFSWDSRTIRNGLNFTLVTPRGDIDLLGEIVGGGAYEQLLEDSLELEIFGMKALCLGLRALIHAKRAAGRPKDLEAVAELEAVLEERERQPSS